MERGVFGVGTEVGIDSASFDHESTEVRLVFGRHIVPAPAVAVEVGMLHAGIAENLAADAFDTEVADGTCQFLEVGMGVHRVEVAHHVEVALQRAVGGDGACVVRAGFEFMLRTQCAEGCDGSEHLLCGGRTHHLVSVVTPHGNVVGEVEHADAHMVGGTVCLCGKRVESCSDLFFPGHCCHFSHIFSR